MSELKVQSSQTVRNQNLLNNGAIKRKDVKMTWFKKKVQKKERKEKEFDVSEYMPPVVLTTLEIQQIKVLLNVLKGAK